MFAASQVQAIEGGSVGVEAETAYAARIEKPASILVYVGLDLIGDATMKLPFIYALRQAFPDAHITWLAGKGASVFAREMAPLVKGVLDEVIDNAGIGNRPIELLRRPLAGRHFDLVIDTQRRVLSTLILRRIRHRCFVSGAARYSLSDIRPAKRGKPRAMTGQLSALFELVHGRPGQTVCGVPCDPATEVVAERLMPRGRHYVGFAPGAGMEIKRWPLVRYLAVAKAAAEAGRVPVFLLGPAEVGLAETIRAELPSALLPLQAAGEASPVITISLARRMAAAVANDCGAGHLIAAAGAPLVSLFGPTPPDKFAPAANRLVVLKAQDWGGDAMDAIPVDAVLRALESFFV